MVQEVRDIILSLDEVKTAFVCHQRITPEFLPQCRIVSCNVGKDAIILTVETGAENEKQCKDMTFKGIDVLRPVIRFCIENNIMLPKGGKKSLIFGQDKLMMHIELDLQTDLPAIVSPMHLNHADMLAVARSTRTIGSTR